MQTHPAAELFPMLAADRLAELADDIKQNGLKQPITLCEGMILDGRNRFAACEMAGVEPTFREFEGGDPYSWVWSLNGQRRDLSAEHRAAIWLECNAQSEQWARRQEEIREEANRKRSEAAKEQHAHTNPRAGESFGERTTCAPTIKTDVREEAARASNTNRGAIERQQALREKRPDLAAKVRAGEIKPTQAVRLMKREELSQRVAELPDGQYRVIYADPPWQYGDERGGLAVYEGSAAEGQYPTMPVSDICALDVRRLSAPDAVLFMWATFPLLPDAIEVVKAWGFTYKTAFVWDKQRPNMGNYHNACAELLIVATRGSCTPEIDTRPPQVQAVPRGRHSEKPEHFRQLIDTLYPTGPRIELFRRGDAPEGWTVWGNEAAA